MLSDEVLENITEELAKKMDDANEYVIKEIAQTIKKIGEMTPTEATRSLQILKYGGDYEKMVKKLSQMTNLTQKDIKKVFEAEAKKDLQYAKRFYEFRDKKYIPWDQNEALQKQVVAITSAVSKNIQHITDKKILGIGIIGKNKKVQIKPLKQAYYDIIDRCVLSISQGKDTYDALMYKQIKALGEVGLRVIYPTTYIDKDGKEQHYTRRLDSAMRMNIMDSLRALHNETQEELGKQFDADGVEITVHSYPAPDHAYAQGKQLKLKEWEKLQTTGKAETYDGKHLDIRHESGFFRPISEYNCYHNARSIILGVNKPQYTNEQLEEIIEENKEGFIYKGRHYTMYEGTQMQRRLETEIRKQKEFQISAYNSGNEQGFIKAQTKIKNIRKEYKALSQASGLKPKANRMRVPFPETSID